MKALKDLASFLRNNTVAGDYINKVTFGRKGKKAMKELAALLGLTEGTYDVCYNAGGIAVSGEVTLHAENIYVQIAEFGVPKVLFRSCKGRKDYCGGQNNFMTVDKLATPEGIKTLFQVEQKISFLVRA